MDGNKKNKWWKRKVLENDNKINVDEYDELERN